MLTYHVYQAWWPLMMMKQCSWPCQVWGLERKSMFSFPRMSALPMPIMLHTAFGHGWRNNHWEGRETGVEFMSVGGLVRRPATWGSQMSSLLFCWRTRGHPSLNPESCNIIYPGKGFDDWWDLKQLMEKMVHAINIFEQTHPNQIGIFLFDCSSAHKGLSHNALNVNNMNINPGSNQHRLWDTTIPLWVNNPSPKSGCSDTHSQPQSMKYPPNHPDPALQGKAKGLKVVLRERESVWDEMIVWNGRKQPVWKCKECKKSQVKKDAEQRAAEAKNMERKDTLEAEDVMQAEEGEDPQVAGSPISEWCCCYHVLSLQEDFINK